MRVIEFGVSAACGVYLLTQLQAVPNTMLWVYVPTAIGGLVFTYLLFVSRTVPQPIAVLGLIGYALLLLGVPLDLLGIVDMDAGAGMLLLAPGGFVRSPGPAHLVVRQGLHIASAGPGMTLAKQGRQVRHFGPK
ncbi:hypothetical protein [Nonomuraea endophytica]|uniref:hypothetical protein n=1 Tax=Nonomuraea endophytica TaxID=714136 RepID=UPI0037C949E9